VSGAATEAVMLERALLGSLMLDPALLDGVVGTVEASDLRSASHRAIYGAILALDGEGGKVDPVLVHERLRGDPSTAGCVEEICESLDSPLTLINAQRYAEALLKLGALRSLYRSVHDAGQTLRDGNPETLLGTMDDLDAATETIRARLAHGGGGTLREALAATFTALEYRMAEKGRRYIETGLIDLDAKLRMRRGKFTVVGARPSMGKSALAKDIAVHVARQGHGVVVFTLEDTVEDWLIRAVSGMADVPLWRIMEGHCTEEDSAALFGASDDLSVCPLHVEDQPGITVAEIRAHVRRHKRICAKQGVELRLVIVDYLQLLGTPARKGRDRGREQEVAEMSRSLKALSKVEGVHVMLLAQLNRECERRADKRPGLSDLRESGSIEQDADAVVFVHRAERYDPADNPGGAEIIVAKQKNGPCGVVRLHFDGAHVRFQNATKEW